MEIRTRKIKHLRDLGEECVQIHAKASLPLPDVENTTLIYIKDKMA